jgi:aryl-alcohol dehydrogenase-like predicted oxidoreductase
MPNATLRLFLDKLHTKEGLTDLEVHQLLQAIHELEERSWSCEELETSDELAPAIKAQALSGYATYDGTERFAAHFGEDTLGFYRSAQDVLVSSVGIGTYRGARDNKTDAAYATAVYTALQRGVNVIDTSLNYRGQRSERNVAAGLELFLQRDGGRRDGIVVCTKGGYLVRGAVTRGTLDTDDVVRAGHSIAPTFLADQIDRSRRNLGLETIDIYFIHNPEVQLQSVSTADFMTRITAAFDRLERAVSEGLIRYYGTATWDGYRTGALSMRAVAGAARQVAGDNHHFRYVQLPFNLRMQEADSRDTGSEGSLLDIAAELGISIIASASLSQGRLCQDLPIQMASLLPGLNTDAQRALQFTRSATGITSALVGMREITHVEENLAVRKVQPLSPAEYHLLRSAADLYCATLE